MRRLTAIWPVLLALGLAWSNGCCRQGYVLHGDWSLGLSHAPPAGCQCASQCNVPCQGGQGRCGKCSACLAQNAGQNAGQDAAHDAGRKHCARGSRSDRAASTANVPGPTGPSQGHPRFHPVPTRPVFGPVSPPQIVPVAAPEMEEPQVDDPEQLPPPRPLPNSARRSGVRQASASAQRGGNYRR